MCTTQSASITQHSHPFAAFGWRDRHSSIFSTLWQGNPTSLRLPYIHAATPTQPYAPAHHLYAMLLLRERSAFQDPTAGYAGSAPDPTQSRSKVTAKVGGKAAQHVKKPSRKQASQFPFT